MDRRTRARELVMQALYQLDVQGDDLLRSIDIFFRENEDDKLVVDMAKNWTQQCWRNRDKCDEIIQQAAIKWQLSRLSLVDKSILRLAAFQLLFCEDIPGKVVINEAIELAKKYSSQQSSRFVNGVLDAILKRSDSGR